MYGIYRLILWGDTTDRHTLSIALASFPISATYILAKMQLSFRVCRFPPEKVFGIISSHCCPFCKSHPKKKFPTEFHLQFLRISLLTCDSSYVSVSSSRSFCCWASDCYQSLVYTSFMYNVCLKNGIPSSNEKWQGVKCSGSCSLFNFNKMTWTWYRWYRDWEIKGMASNSTTQPKQTEPNRTEYGQKVCLSMGKWFCTEHYVYVSFMVGRPPVHSLVRSCWKDFLFESNYLCCFFLLLFVCLKVGILFSILERGQKVKRNYLIL